MPELLVEVAIRRLIEGLGFLGFLVCEKRKNLIFRVTAQKLESVGKVSELCVTDIYTEFVKSFHIQRGQTNNSLMTK